MGESKAQDYLKRILFVCLFLISQVGMAIGVQGLTTMQ